MAHFARVNEDNIVEQVVVVDDLHESNGEEYLHGLGLTGRWIQTSYNARIRGVFAQEGFSYDPEADVFIATPAPMLTSAPLSLRPNGWVPSKPAPEDATWVVDLQPEPEGHSELEQKRIYFWMDEFEEWGMAACACIPKPEGDYYWHPIAKEWQAPTSEKPEGNYFWNVFKKEWVEIPALPEAPTE